MPERLTRCYVLYSVQCTVYSVQYSTVGRANCDRIGAGGGVGCGGWKGGAGARRLQVLERLTVRSDATAALLLMR